MMSQPAASSPPEGGAPEPGGRGSGADGLAPKWEEVRRIRKMITELRVKLAKAKKNVDVSRQRSILSWLETKLDLVAMYFTLLEIEQQASQGTLDSYARNRLREIIADLTVDDIEDPLFYAVRSKAQQVQEFVDSLNAIGDVEKQMDDIATAIRRLEKDVLTREGWNE